jgi:hypothetical protein
MNKYLIASSSYTYTIQKEIYDAKNGSLNAKPMETSFRSIMLQMMRMHVMEK